MPVLGNSGPPASAAAAYDSSNANANNRRNVWLIIAAVTGLLLIRNVVTKDYSEKHKSYLKSVGRDDLIAKTARERSEEAIAQQELIGTLATRVTELEVGQMALRAEIKALRGGSGGGKVAATAGSKQTRGQVVDLFGGDDG